VPCSLILPEQQVVTSAWRARWTSSFLISPSAPPYLYRILYRQTKKHIDSSFNRRLFRLLIMLPPHLSQSPLLSNYSRTSLLVLSLPFDLSPPCLVILCINFFTIQVIPLMLADSVLSKVFLMHMDFEVMVYTAVQPNLGFWFL
jgi:hypothetical protein